MSRPQRISNKAFLQAAYEVIMEYGAEGLTFKRLAEKVGVVPAAVARRFRNKRQLIAAIDQFALRRSLEARQHARQQYDSPLEAIIAGMTVELVFATSLKTFANGLSFLLYDLRDPDLYANYQLSFKERHQQTVHLLQEAKQCGELINSVDPEQLAVLLQTVQHGTGHVWAMTQTGSIKQNIEHNIRLALQPYVSNTRKEE